MKAYVLFGVRKTDWQAMTAQEKQQVKNYFNRFADGEFTPVTWVQANNPTIEWWICSFSVQSLSVKADKITQAKIDEVQGFLDAHNIQVRFSDDCEQELRDAGLIPEGELMGE